MVVRLYYVRKYVGYTISSYIKQILYPYVKVIIPSFAAIAFLPCYNWTTFILVGIVSVLVYTSTLYFCGFNNTERIEAYKIIKPLIYKIIRK